jgi:hypothetical protein
MKKEMLLMNLLHDDVTSNGWKHGNSDDVRIEGGDLIDQIKVHFR